MKESKKNIVQDLFNYSLDDIIAVAKHFGVNVEQPTIKVLKQTAGKILTNYDKGNMPDAKDIENLPSEIQYEILVKLDPKSLAQMCQTSDQLQRNL